MGKALVMTGLLIALAGIVIIGLEKGSPVNWLSWFGRLPFDIRIERESFRFYFPIGSSLLLSALVSLVIHLIKRFFN